MTQGRELTSQLYLEGRSIPFQSAVCNWVAGQPATATIEMVPLREINDILPRTMVHIFVKDFSHPFVAKPWVLLFEGEVYSYGMRKNAGGRSFVIKAMGISNYWDNAKQYYMNAKLSQGGSQDIFTNVKGTKEAESVNADIKKSVLGLQAYITKLVSDKLNEKGTTYIDAVLEALKGVEEVNPFFRFNQARYRINDRIMFQTSGKIKELIDLLKKDKLLESYLGRGNGGLVTMRQVINMLMGLVFHDFVSVPAPSKVKKDNFESSTLTTTTTVETGATLVTQIPGENISTTETTTTTTTGKGIGRKNDKTIASFLFKPNSHMLPPPKCNVIFPDQYDNFSFNRNFFHEVTRLKFQPNLTTQQIIASSPKVFQKTFVSPAGFNEFYTKEKGETEGVSPQFESEVAQGNIGDDAKDDIKTNTVLSDANFLSREEILKGIFSDRDSVMPSAQMVAKIVPADDQKTFYQRATDYLFHKKRLAARAVSVSGPLNIAPVPGFNILVIDDSAAEQHVMGTLTGITHSISATQGGYTTYEVAYGRYIEEKDLWDDTCLAEPPVPPWFDPDVFGKSRKLKPADYINLPKSLRDRVKNFKTVNDFGDTTLKDYYTNLLGEINTTPDSNFVGLGAGPITSKKFPNVIAATLNIAQQYKAEKQNKEHTAYINKFVRRDYTYLTETFEFLGAIVKGKLKRASFAQFDDTVFSGERFDGGYVENTDSNARDTALKRTFGTDVTKKRRAVLNAYRKKLLKERGFRG